MQKIDLRKSFDISRIKLDNGLDVIIIDKPGSPVVSINLAYKVGSKDEAEGKTGLAHLFEHMMFEGTKNVPKGEFDKLCSLAGGTNNAYTTYDWTAYTMTLPSHQLELGLWLESDRMMNFDILQSTLANQQKVVTEEISQTIDNQPYGKWRVEQAKAAFMNSCSYSWEVHGNVDDVAAATVGDCREFHSFYYRPGNACLIICGDVDNDEAFNLVNKYFQQPGMKGEIRRNAFKKSDALGGKRVEFSDNVPLSAVFLSYHIGGFMNEEEMLSGEVLANIASNGRSSRLYNSLVYEKQAASSAGAFADKREHSSLITFYAIANSPDIKCEELNSHLISEIDKFASTEVEDKELEKSRNIVTASAANEIQYSSGIADLVANNALFWDDPFRVYGLLDKYHNVNKKDIRKIANKYFTNGNSVRTDVVPG